MIFTIDSDNNITAFATHEDAAAATSTPFQSFTTEHELAELAANWPTARLVEIWNSLPGVNRVRKVKNAQGAINQIWKRIQGLCKAAEPAEPAEPAAEPAEPKATKKATADAQPRKGAPAKGKATKKAMPAKKAPKGKKVAQAAQVQEEAPHREGSKTAQVVAMLQRKSGATLVEIMETMGWQRHTVRGFMAGAMKKAGYAVESFKPEGGERSYRINK